MSWLLCPYLHVAAVDAVLDLLLEHLHVVAVQRQLELGGAARRDDLCCRAAAAEPLRATQVQHHMDGSVEVVGDHKALTGWQRWRGLAKVNAARANHNLGQLRSAQLSRAVGTLLQVQQQSMQASEVHQL